MNTTILLRLIFAHFIGDFLLQPDKLCEGKQCGGARKYLFQAIHAAVQAVLAYLFAAMWNCWLIPVVVFISHFIIDTLKSIYGKGRASAFFADQLLHITVLTALWYFVSGENSGYIISRDAAQYFSDSTVWLVLSAYLIVLQPTSIFLSLFIRKWTPTDIPDRSLPNAGKWIGYLERILILTFIFTGYVECVGFLLAAKSIFRFGELNKSSEIKTTEYVLIGTFASFTVALLVGFIAKTFI